MNGATLAGWIVALASIGALIVSVWQRRTDTSKAQMEATVKPVKDEVERHQEEMKRMTQEMASVQKTVGEVRQQVLDHEATCRERMANISDMFEEIRADVKVIMREKKA